MKLIARQSQILFSAYRRDDFSDPEGFFAQLGVVFEGYPDPVIVAVTDPRTGLQRRIKWPPTIAEVVEACDAEVVAMDTRRRYAAMPKPQPVAPRITDRSPGRRANLFIPADVPQYLAALEWSRTADAAEWKYDLAGRAGIWVIYNWGGYGPRPTPKALHTFTDDELRQMYSPRPAAAE